MQKSPCPLNLSASFPHQILIQAASILNDMHRSRFGTTRLLPTFSSNVPCMVRKMFDFLNPNQLLCKLKLQSG